MPQGHDHPGQERSNPVVFSIGYYKDGRKENRSFHAAGTVLAQGLAAPLILFDAGKQPSERRLKIFVP